ncbi:hypothetical protein AcW1_001977 [Taiwanofungus camphoratus]|nr:hypothetical protein AcV5_009972 [Antrodia cinnamomea]KAI0944218.1 hypothetical protein AcW1_001977 [Antrodia cinnamomea]KAI0945854.1 hypothetical protein AcV7_009980 [Antrodia cinnamomea]
MSDVSNSELRDTLPDLPDPIVQQWHSTPEDRYQTSPSTPHHHRSAAAALHVTPLKSSTIGNVTEEDGNIENEAVKRYVLEHFRDKVHRGLPVHEFVRVWDFTPDEIPVVRGMRSYSLKLSSLNMYLRRGWENSSYKYLVSILEHLRKQVLSGDRTLLRGNRAASACGYQYEPNFCHLEDFWVRGNHTVPFK